jgi:cell wall-associated NlpC family hydrolase
MISGGLSGGGTARVLTNPPITMSKDSWQYQRVIYAFTNIVRSVSDGLKGTLYLKGGKDPQTGLDCSGFTKYVYGNAGYMIPDGAVYQYNYFRDNNMLFPTPKEGDLFFWKNRDGSYHTGIVRDFPREGEIGIIDAPGAKRKIDYRTFDTNGEPWKSSILGYGRVIE